MHYHSCRALLTRPFICVASCSVGGMPIRVTEGRYQVNAVPVCHVILTLIFAHFCMGVING